MSIVSVLLRPSSLPVSLHWNADVGCLEFGDCAQPGH